jgi:hypothetical protein
MACQDLYTTRRLLRLFAEAIVVVGLAATSLASGALPASAAPLDPVPPQRHPWGYDFGVEDRGQAKGSGSGNSGDDGQITNVSGGGGEPPPDFCGGFRFGVQACDLPQIPTDQNLPSPTAPTPAQLAQEAWRRLPIPAPEVATAPPRGSDGLVGLAQWFWVSNWEGRRDRVQVGGVWAEVTARPTRLTINPGAGQAPVVCSGPGTPYDPRRSVDGQPSDCSFTYVRSSAGLPNSAYQVAVTVTWGGTWEGSGGTGGTLPVLSRSTSFPLRVAEGQAVAGG